MARRHYVILNRNKDKYRQKKVEVALEQLKDSSDNYDAVFPFCIDIVSEHREFFYIMIDEKNKEDFEDYLNSQDEDSQDEDSQYEIFKIQNMKTAFAKWITIYVGIENIEYNPQSRYIRTVKQKFGKYINNKLD